MICISIGNRDLFQQVNTIMPDLVEIRYDLMDIQPDEVDNLLHQDIRQIATCRPGKYSPTQRVDLLKRSIDLHSAYVDIEIESETEVIDELKSYVLTRKCNLIISYHNYERTPGRSELQAIEESCYARGGNIAKLACMVSNEQDNANLLSLYASEGRKVIIGMGEKGRITRMVAEELGAEFSFVSATQSAATAPGQLSYNAYLAIKEILLDK
ncbi:type I 3-dehydroquinate dehydratase [Bacteroidota bacterium]